MGGKGDGAVLLARLRLVCPRASSILFACTETSRSVVPAAQSLARAIVETGESVHWLDLGPHGTVAADGASALVIEPASFSELERLRKAIAPPVGFTVIAGTSILQDAHTILLSAVADATILVCWRGSTSRQDLEQAREEVRRSGGTIAGAVLLT